MSTTITIRRPSTPGRLIPRRQRLASTQRSAPERVHLAEQAYAAELAHAERARASAHQTAAAAPTGEKRTARAVRGLRLRRSDAPTQADSGAAPAAPSSRERRRWLALAVLCLGQLMMVLDATIVNVALPSIQSDLHFSQGNLTWVMNGYLITFGGFLLLAGRFGDLVGRKRVFLTGLVMFTVASVLCGIADSQVLLIGARLLQGIGGAVASSVILAIIVTEFPARAEQAKAMGLYAFVSAGGGSIGLLAGGVLTQSLDWHWIFFVNVPIGLIAFVLGRALIVENEGIGIAGGVDWLGSALITLATMAGAFAIVKSTEFGLLSARTLGVGAVSLVLLGAFLALESRLENPIMPLRVLRLRMLMGSSLVRGLLVTGMFSAFFLGSLYLERVLGYDAINTGLAFLPLTASIAVMSLGLSARAAERFGALNTLAAGLASIVGGSVAAVHRGHPRGLLPGAVLRVPADRPRRRSVVPAAADDRYGRRAEARCRLGLGHHQRLGAAVRGDRPGEPRHDRDRPHEGTERRRRLGAGRADRRLSPRLRGRGDLRRGRDPRRLLDPASARGHGAPGDRAGARPRVRLARARRSGCLSDRDGAPVSRPPRGARRLTPRAARPA